MTTTSADSCDPEFGCVYQFNNAPVTMETPVALVTPVNKGMWLAG